MKRINIMAALSASVVSMLLLAGCSTTIATGSSGPDPVNLNDPTAVSALCDTSAQDALDTVTAAAEAKENSGQRNVLTTWGLSEAEAKDEAKLEEVKASLQTRVETPCEGIPANAETIGVEDHDGKVTVIPVYGSAETIVLDSTQDPNTPPLGASLLDGSKRYLTQALSWSGIVEAVGEQGWYVDGVNSFAAQTGFDWEDVQKFAAANKMVDGKVQGVNALAIQVFNLPDLTEAQAEDELIKLLGDEQVKELEAATQVSIRDLPIQWINGGFKNTRNVGSTLAPKMGEFFDTSPMVRITLMPITFNEKGEAVSLDGSRGAGIFIDCLNLHWVPKSVWYCETGSCEKPPPPPVVPPWTPPVTPPDTPECEHNCGNTPKGNRYPPNQWTPLEPGPLTDGNQSRDQLESGDTRGNAVDDQVPSDTSNGSVTPDTIPSDQGGPVAPGANTGGDNREDDVTDPDLVTDDPGGTNGGTCETNPFTGESNC